MARIIRIRAEKILRRMLKQDSQNITRITIPEVGKKDYKIEGLKSR